MTGDNDSRAMACLSAIREGRRWLDDVIAKHVEEHFVPTPTGGQEGPAATPAEEQSRKKEAEAQLTDESSTVRSEYAYHIAEFFYVARELGLLTRERLPLLIDRHNADMNELLKRPDKTWRKFGIGQQRVKRAIFSQGQRDKIFNGQDCKGQELIYLDQSDVGKLLSPLMAPEVCRQVLGAMAKGGLLKSWGYTRVFVSSPGILEDYFRDHLMMIDRAIRGDA